MKLLRDAHTRFSIVRLEAGAGAHSFRTWNTADSLSLHNTAYLHVQTGPGHEKL